MTGNFLDIVYAADKIPGVAAKTSSYFYTGKPYDKDLAGYSFSARNYNPNLNRWTTPDPSGFPNGANNAVYAENRSTSFFDPSGFTDKSAVLLYAYTDYAPVDNVFAPDVSNEENNIYNKLTNLDSTQTPDPHYLDDGDTLESGSIGKPSDLSAYSDYGLVVLIVHGMNINGQPSWNVGCGKTKDPSKRYTTADLTNYISGLVIIGCGWHDTTESDAFSQAESAITKYLYE